jgi:predicted nucleic acid-binding protein
LKRNGGSSCSEFKAGEPALKVSEPRLLAEFLAASGTEVYDLCRPPELLEAASLMEKYPDTPMDFADATLLLLAEALDLHDILTLDRRGFSAYRTRRRRSLRLILDAG